MSSLAIWLCARWLHTCRKARRTLQKSAAWARPPPLALFVDEETGRRVAPGVLWIAIAFSGTLFDSPTPNAYTLAKSLFLDLFRGQDAAEVDVEGLQYIIHFAAEEEQDGKPKPQIHMRVYKIVTQRSGQIGSEQ